MDEVQNFLESARNTFDAFAQQVSAAELHAAAELIWSAQAEGNRVHVTGIGKPGHVATYLASLMSSTGTPTYFLHGTEAVHGSCGQLVPGDVVICVFNSGETAEMKAFFQQELVFQVLQLLYFLKDTVLIIYQIQIMDDLFLDFNQVMVRVI